LAEEADGFGHVTRYAAALKQTASIEEERRRRALLRSRRNAQHPHLLRPARTLTAYFYI
jgi:hypothetical protein